MLFNSSFVVVEENAGYLPVNDNINAIQILATDLMIMKEAGFLEIFVNNDAKTPVYYDNMRVVMRGGNVMEVNAYYPFGMIIPNLSTWLTYPNEENYYKYNGKELQKDLNLNWLDYGARMYDPGVARWQGPDPMAEKYYSISPYAYVANNPIRYIDPDGRLIWTTSDPEQIKRLLEDLKRIYSEKYGEEKVKEDPFSFRTIETETSKYHVLEANQNFDWNLDEYTRAMKEIIDDKYGIRMVILGDPDKVILDKFGGGKVRDDKNSFELSSRLANYGDPGTKGAESHEWTIGGVFLHETIYHFHYRGQIEQNKKGIFGGKEYVGPHYMRAYYNTRAWSKLKEHAPGTYYKFPSGGKVTKLPGLN